MQIDWNFFMFVCVSSNIEYNNAGASEPIVIYVQTVKSNLSLNFDNENVKIKKLEISMCPITDVTNGFGSTTWCMRNF